MIRIVAWVVFAGLAGVLLVRAGAIAIVMPYALWLGFRESGYPWWVQGSAALALLAGFAYLFRKGTFDRWQRR